VDVDFDRKVDYIYAGDLQGNLWKFDVNCTGTATNGDYLSCQQNSTSTEWQVANGGKPLFVACDNNAPCGRQPITSKPQVGSVSADQANALYASNQTTSSSNQNKPSVMVYFGTGIYLGLTDVTNTYASSTQQQTVYALWDKNVGTASTDNSIAGRSSLLQQTILNPNTIIQNGTGTPATNVRVTSVAPSNNVPCYQTTACTVQTTNGTGQTTSSSVSPQSGWYMDLSTTPRNLSERSVSSPTLLNGNIVFTTFTPAPDPCTTQASSWIMELNAITGNAPSSPAFLNIFGTNLTGNTPSNDLVTVNGATMVPSGIQSTMGILKTPALIYGKGVVNKYFGGSTSGIQMVTDPGLTLGRVSWRQLR
jgi:type IV pilus assembly protein PilY1